MDKRIREKITSISPENHRQSGLLEICLLLCNEIEKLESRIQELKDFVYGDDLD